MTAKNAGSTFLHLSIPLFSLLFLGSMFFSKTSSFVFLNSIHSPALNQFFQACTFLGDGLFPVILATVLLLFRKKELALKIMLSFLASGLIVQVLKAFFHAPRPKAFFASIHLPYQNFIDGITHSGMNSFPSGHTTTVFALAATLAFNSTCKYRCGTFFILATFTLYSRIYLGQHFLEDTTAGMLVGIGMAIILEKTFGRLKLIFDVEEKTSLAFLVHAAFKAKHKVIEGNDIQSGTATV